VKPEQKLHQDHHVSRHQVAIRQQVGQDRPCLAPEQNEPTSRVKRNQCQTAFSALSVPAGGWKTQPTTSCARRLFFFELSQQALKQGQKGPEKG
jgi:hypothetical protein